MKPKQKDEYAIIIKDTKDGDIVIATGTNILYSTQAVNDLKYLYIKYLYMKYLAQILFLLHLYKTQVGGGSRLHASLRRGVPFLFW